MKRCAEMARKLRFFKEQLKKDGLLPSTSSYRCDDIDMDRLEVSCFLRSWYGSETSILLYLCSISLGVVQAKLGELETELIEINANNEKLQSTYAELLEYKIVLQKVCSSMTPISSLCLQHWQPRSELLKTSSFCSLTPLTLSCFPHPDSFLLGWHPLILSLEMLLWHEICSTFYLSYSSFRSISTP